MLFVVGSQRMCATGVDSFYSGVAWILSTGRRAHGAQPASYWSGFFLLWSRVDFFHEAFVFFGASVTIDTLGCMVRT